MVIAIIITLAVCISLSNIACLTIALKMSQKVENGEEVKLPELKKFTPKGIIESRAEAKEQQRKQEEYEKILANIDRFDGTDNGQVDI